MLSKCEFSTQATVALKHSEDMQHGTIGNGEFSVFVICAGHIEQTVARMMSRKRKGAHYTFNRKKSKKTGKDWFMGVGTEEGEDVLFGSCASEILLWENVCVYVCMCVWSGSATSEI